MVLSNFSQQVITIILTHDALLANSIQDNLPSGLQMQKNIAIHYLGDNWENKIENYRKIDLLITDIDCQNLINKFPGFIGHKIKTIVNLNADCMITNEEIKLPKPFRLIHLLKIISTLAYSEEVFQAIGNDFVYNERSRSITSKTEKIKLTEQENKIFRFLLLSNKFQAEKGSLMKKLWKYHENTESSTLDTHLYRLKNKLPPGMLVIRSNMVGLCI